MRFAIFLVAAAAAALTGCGDAAVEPAPLPAPTPPEPAPPEPAPARERHHASAPRFASSGRHGAAWQPSAEAQRLARRLGDPATRAATLERLDDLPAGERIDVLRAGLRLEDPDQARFAASLLQWTWIDEWESALAVQLLGAWIYTRPDDVDFGKFRRYLGSSELGPVLAGAAGAPEVAADNNYVGQLHRQVRAEHIPVLVDLCRSEHRRFAADTLLTLGNVLAYADGPRARVGELLASTDARAADEGPLPRGAVPPELARGLRAALLGEGLDEKTANDARNWALRWLADVRPSAGDAEFLLDLHRRLGGDGEADWRVQVQVLRALSFLDDADSLAVLRSVRGDGAVAAIADALLARRGDAAAEAAAWERFATHGPTMALLVESDPRRAAVALSRALLSTESSNSRAALDAFAEAVTWRALYRLHWDRSAFALVRSQAPGAGITPAALGRIALLVPGCRTRAVAEALLDRIGAHPTWLQETLDGTAWRRAVVGFLEVADGERLREVLRAKAAGRDAGERSAALWVLLRLGDAPSGPRLVDFVRESRPAEDDDSVPMLLSRSRHESVASYLRGVVEEGGADADPALAALASYHGLPERVAAEVVEVAFRADDPDPELRIAVRTAVLAGHPLDGLAAVLAARPDRPFQFVGDAGPDPRVVAYLQRLRDERRLGEYAWATGELALLGDPEARAEVEAAVRAGRYRWVDDWRGEVLLAGADPGFWLDEAETNCCRLVVAGRVFDDVYGQSYGDLMEYESGRGDTAADALRRWWAGTGGGPFAWSHMMGAYVPLPW